MELPIAAAILFLAAVHTSSTLPPPCPSKVYCQSQLLHDVQMARLFNDSKEFVDRHMIKSENDTLEDYQVLLDKFGNLTKDQLEKFVDEHFISGTELVNWSPDDYVESPALLKKIQDPLLRQFAKEVISIWPNLTRKVNPEVSKNPDRHSLIDLPNGFAVPGGRFKEIYYWDSYWIIEGLILSEMTNTARGMIENLLYLVKKFGHVPNGSRVYYMQRSQPPLLTAMVAKYVLATNDIKWLNQNINTLETELKFWLNERSVEVKRGSKSHTLLRYNAESEGPRPESYYEDFTNSEVFEDDERRQEFFSDMKSAAESGWDFSSRWFINENGTNRGNLSDIQTRRIIPVDLNSIYANALQTLGDLYIQLNDRRSAITWWSLAAYWKTAIDEILWDDEDGVWYDYDLQLQSFRKYFYPTNVAPLWARAVDADKMQEYVPRVLDYLNNCSALEYLGGIPTSIEHTGEQWDFPNAWPPLQSIVIQALRNTQDPEGLDMARDLAERWVRSNHIGYSKTKLMFEKYDAEEPGSIGGGGEYVVQSGFGWTNGVVLELLNIYGENITAYDS